MDPSFFRSSKGRLLFSIRGRISRTEFWVGMTVILAITTLAVLIAGHRTGVRGLSEFFGIVAVIALASPFCLVAIVIKRLHDIDRSGWWALALLIPLLLGAVALIAFAGLREEGRIVEEWKDFWTSALYVTAGLAIASLAYVITKLGFTRGTAGTNRFGPDSLSMTP
jgi:uncharacterized membrane protein YhaH (DUF805 family)